jgi:hypothetical protein
MKKVLKKDLIAMILSIILMNPACKTVQNDEKSTLNDSYSLEQKRKEKTVLNEDVWEGIKKEMISDECRGVKSKELMKKLNDFGKCEQDIDCISLFDGSGSVNRKFLQDHIKTNEEFNKECLSPDYEGWTDLSIPASEYVFYCSDDGYCNSVIKSELEKISE